jgi:predicted ATPase/DNA-binding winged helix-turn-helix (wHTH) protein
MHGRASQVGTLEFGQLSVDTVARKVQLSGACLNIGGRAYDLLMALLQSRERVVTKRELTAAVWPSVVVEPNNLHVQIAALRRLLGAQSIVTVPGVGYQFVGTTSSDALPGATFAADQMSDAPAEEAGSLIGRERDQAEMDRLFLTCRLLTIVGPAGVGKTALARHWLSKGTALKGRRTVWVDLAQIGGEFDVIDSLSSALQVELSPRQRRLQVLSGCLARDDALIVFDSAEVALDQLRPLLEELLERCPDIRVLVLSQAPTLYAAEVRLRLPPLGCPDASASYATACDSPAVSLFVQLARQIDGRFVLTRRNVGTVADICRKLDGLPMAIRLAASKVRVLGLDELNRHLNRRFEILKRDESTTCDGWRYGSLFAALDLSYQLLSLRGQALLRALSVFPDCFKLRQVTCLLGYPEEEPWRISEALDELIDQSLLEVHGVESPSYKMLESVRAYAHAKAFAADETITYQRALIAVVLQTMQRARAEVDQMSEAAWLSLYRDELPSLRSAMQLAMQADVASAAEIVVAAFELMASTGIHVEASRWLVRIVERADAIASISLRAELFACAAIHGNLEDQGFTRTHALAALHWARQSSVPQAEFLALCSLSAVSATADIEPLVLRAQKLCSPSWSARQRFWLPLVTSIWLVRCERYEDAELQVLQCIALARRSGSVRQILTARHNLAYVKLLQGKDDEAVELLEAVVGQTDAHRHVRVQLFASAVLANHRLATGLVEEAESQLRRYFDAAQSADYQTIALFGDVFSLYALMRGRVGDAAMLHGFAEAAYSSIAFRYKSLASCRESVLATLGNPISPGYRSFVEEGRQLQPSQVAVLTLG